MVQIAVRISEVMIIEGEKIILIWAAFSETLMGLQ